MIPARLRGLLWASIHVALLSVCSPASAAAGRIALVGGTQGDAVTRQLRAELATLGFEVVEIAPPDGPPAREPLVDAARTAGAVAAVRIAPSRRGVEVWVLDRVTGKAVLTEIADTGDGAVSREATIALRTVELLRASLLEIHLKRPSHGEVAPTEEPAIGADGSLYVNTWMGLAAFRDD